MALVWGIALNWSLLAGQVTAETFSAWPSTVICCCQRFAPGREEANVAANAAALWRWSLGGQQAQREDRLSCESLCKQMEAAILRFTVSWLALKLGATAAPAAARCFHIRSWPACQSDFFRRRLMLPAVMPRRLPVQHGGGQTSRRRSFSRCATGLVRDLKTHTCLPGATPSGAQPAARPAPGR
jgi:hypothetical protein